MQAKKIDIIAFCILILGQITYDLFASLTTNWAVFYYSILYLSLAAISIARIEKNHLSVVWLAISCTFIIRFGFMIANLNSDYSKFLQSVNNLQVNLILAVWCTAILTFCALKLSPHDKTN